MRIAKVHNYYLQPGGEDSVFNSECDLLCSKGHEVFEYIESNSRIESMKKVDVALQTLWSRSSYNRMQNFLREKRPDVVHFHNIFPLISPSVYYACKDLGIPVVQTLDNQRLICPSASFYRNGKLCIDCLGKNPPWPGVLHACYRNSRIQTAVVASMLTFHRFLRTWQRKIDMFLCSTSFYRNIFIEAGLPPEKLVVMPHFVSPIYVSKTDSKTEGYVLFVGRLDPEKGVKTLLNAWRLLDIDIPLKVRGNGQLEELAKRYVKEKNLDQVEFVERLTASELSDLVANARFLIMPSEGYYETFGMVIVEAFSKGIPVLASNIGVATELVEEQKTGIFFVAGDPIDLAEKAKWMWTHKTEIEKMGKKGMTVYQERYKPDICYDTLFGVYQRIVRSI